MKKVFIFSIKIKKLDHKTIKKWLFFKIKIFNNNGNLLLDILNV